MEVGSIVKRISDGCMFLIVNKYSEITEDGKVGTFPIQSRYSLESYSKNILLKESELKGYQYVTSIGKDKDGVGRKVNLGGDICVVVGKYEDGLALYSADWYNGKWYLVKKSTESRVLQWVSERLKEYEYYKFLIPYFLEDNELGYSSVHILPMHGDSSRGKVLTSLYYLSEDYCSVDESFAAYSEYDIKGLKELINVCKSYENPLRVKVHILS